MKVRHVTSSIIPKMLRVDAITIYPFIFYRMKEPSKVLMNHEMIHVEQCRQYGVIRFWLSYILEYLSYRLRGDSDMVAYNKISYEKEAYARQKDYSGGYS